jgi:anti-anti-sigma factor
MGNRHALSIGEAGGDGDFRLILSGELDMDTAPRLESAFTRLCVQGAREIEIDLRGLTFIDTTGLRAIMTAKELCARSH